MSKMLSLGAWRGLKTTSSPTHRFSIVAFDQRGNYVAMLPQDAPFALAAQIKREVITALAPHTTAVLLDPVYSLEAIEVLPGGCGLLMAVEKTGYAGEPHARRIEFMDGWDVGKIKAMGASAVKLLAYYHPDAGEVAEDIERTVSDVAAQCCQYDLPLFLEPLAYSIDPDIPVKSEAFAAQRPAIVRETARRLGAAGATVLKLEFPVDAAYQTDESVWREACEAVSAACDVPWVLLSAGVEYDIFARQVTVACKAGASGYLGGRAVWRESVTATPETRAQFLQDVAVPRALALREIVETHARPWTDFYTPIPAVENWYKDYHV